MRGGLKVGMVLLMMLVTAANAALAKQVGLVLEPQELARPEFVMPRWDDFIIYTPEAETERQPVVPEVRRELTGGQAILLILAVMGVTKVLGLMLAIPGRAKP